jgi:NAD(P)H-flavin reductase
MSGVIEESRDPWLPEAVQVLDRNRETADTFTLRLDVSKRGFAFAPGQFNMLYLFGVGEVAISICGDPTEPDSLVHTIRAVGSVTTPMSRLKRGDTIGIRGPYGSGWPVEQAFGKDVMVIAGGLGIAPLRPVIYEVIRHRARFRNVTILYGARSPSDVVYRKEIARWEKALDVRIHVTVDHAGADWVGRVGVVPALLHEEVLDSAATVAMICGPEVMMRFTVRALARLGLSADRMFLSMERNMKCALRFCGHCQYRESFLCRDGPVLRFDRIASLLERREI